MQRRITLIVLVVLTLLAAACANPATPDPTQVSQLVQQAVQATLAAQPTQPPAPTATTAAPTPIPATATSAPTLALTVAPTSTPTVAPTHAPTSAPTVTPPSGPVVRSDNVVNLRVGPGTNYPLAGTTQAGQSYNIQSRTADSGWFEICCVGERTAWVAASVVTTAGDVASVQVATNIPTPFPTATPAPIPTAAPVAPQAGLHTRQHIGTWEIQAERVQNEKAVYQYDRSKVAMGRYAIIFVLAKNLASGTQSMNDSLIAKLRDDKGRVYDFSDALTTERMAMIYAEWEFSIGQSIFGDVNPGVETPLLMLWDVNEDVQSLTLIISDGQNQVEWNLGSFADIPPYKPR